MTFSVDFFRIYLHMRNIFPISVLTYIVNIFKLLKMVTICSWLTRKQFSWKVIWLAVPRVDKIPRPWFQNERSQFIHLHLQYNIPVKWQYYLLRIQLCNQSMCTICVRDYGYKHYITVGTSMYMILSLHLMSCFGNEATANIASYVYKRVQFWKWTGYLRKVWCPVVLRNDASRVWRHCLIKKYVWQAWCRAVHSWRMEKSTSSRSSGSRMRAPWTTVPQLLASPGAQQSAFRSAYLLLEIDS